MGYRPNRYSRARRAPPPVVKEVIKSKPGSPLALARDAAHQAFDQLWKSKLMTRLDAYSWLAMKLDIPVEYCHMSQFDIRTCRDVVALCLPFREALLSQEFEDLEGKWSDIA